MASFKGDGRAIFLVFVGLILAATLIVPIADSVFTETNIITVTNVTVTAPAINVSLDVQGRTLISETNVSEASNVSNVSNGMFVRSGISTTTGLQSVQLFLNDTAAGFVGVEVNVSYTAEPDGYLQNSGARSMASLIVLFAALAALIFVIVVLVKDGSLGDMMRRG